MLHREGSLSMQGPGRGSTSSVQSPSPVSSRLDPLPTPFPTSHSFPQLLDGHPKGKTRSRFPTQETFKTMDRTRRGHSTHCSDREMEETEAESYPKPHNQQMAEKSLEYVFLTHPLALECWGWKGLWGAGYPNPLLGLKGRKA